MTTGSAGTSCWGTAVVSSSLGVPLGVARQGPAAGACPTSQPGAGSWGPGAAPAPASGTSLGPGRRPAGGPASAGTVAGPGRAVGSWRAALLRCCWASGWRPQGLVWGPGPWGPPRGWAGTVRARGASGASIPVLVVLVIRMPIKKNMDFQRFTLLER